MGKFGFHSGKMSAARAEVSGKYVNEGQWINARSFESSFGGISGAITAENAQGHFYAYAFPQVEVSSGVAINFVAPSSLAAKTGADLKLYWTTSGALAGAVVWDADYWTTSILVSGASTLTSRDYQISGSTAASQGVATVTTDISKELLFTGLTTGAGVSSGVLHTSAVSIPSADISAGDLVSVRITRDAAETADTMTGHAFLIGVLVEYSD